MNQSIELGWNITREDHDDYPEHEKLFGAMAADYPYFEEVGYQVPGTEDHAEGADPGFICLETHPHDPERVFVSWCTPDHGWSDLTEPSALAQLVRGFIKQYDPEAVVTWGVIETRR